MKKEASITAYIDSFPPKTRVLLKKVRATIAKAAPQAEEAIAYGIPTFKLYGNLVHFAGYDHHIGFYPASAGVSHFKKETAKYPTSRGTIQFPLTTPIPFALITKITKFRVQQNLDKAGALFPKISAPATRALASANIKTLKDLSKWTESKLLTLHGIGPSALPKLRAALKAKGISFKV
ncbi:MAG: hypothetical protein RL094_729 [Candidatus Parcubacteria bacterium]|jgi:uncharacterized protein YdhG (YjbR/CyaY superfamily)